MKVNSNRDISFKSIYTNKVFKRSLEFASDNGTLFSAATILAFSTCVRPAAIWLAPKTDKENKPHYERQAVNTFFRSIGSFSRFIGSCNLL